MSHFSIISSQGQHPVLFTGAPRYVGAYLKPGYLEFPEIGSPTAIGWHVGDYVVYSRTGRTYRLYGTPKATEQSDANKFGAAFLYENVQFFDDMKQWELCPFTDLVPGDNTVHFSTQGIVSFFGKPSNVAERLQACLENQYGTGSWEVRIVETSDADLLEILNTEVEFSVSGVNCLQVLDKVYETWNKLGWAYTIENGKNILTIGAPNDRTAANTTESYTYGDGLVAVEKSIANATEIGTRLFAYGSMKNMDATYYRGLDIYHAESVDIEHLMIPISNWGTTSSKPDARKAYIQDATAIAKMGIIPRTAYFDGTGDLPDIHPTIERMTIGEVYDAGGAGYLPDLSKWSRDQRIDEIISATNPEDNGAASDMGVRFRESISDNLDALTEVGAANQYIEPDIYTATLTKSGRLVLKFGRNRQTITLNSAWSARFNVATVEVANGGTVETIPLQIEPESATSFSFVLPEQVVIQNAVAGTLRVGLNIFVLDSAVTAETDTVTIGIDGSTTVEGGVEYMLDKTFSVTIPQIGFDIEKYAALGEGKKISMKTGMCAGRDFEIRDVLYNPATDSWQLTIYRSNDEDLNILFPNEDYPIAAGDQFVLIDIAMPEMYVTVASSRLLEAAQKLLADICEEKPFYAPQIDAKTVIDESRVLLEGLWMDISFNGVQEYALIDSITIDENGSNIPTYDVALRQEKGLDWTENIGSASSGRSSISVSGNESSEVRGTVTSVGLTAPEGFNVSGSPVTSAGILGLSLAPGYKIPRIEELAQYFELGGSGDPSGLVRLKSAYDYLSPRKGLIFDTTAEADVENSPAHLMLRNFGTAQNPNYALYTPYAIVSAKDQIVIDGEPGGGGGGGVMYLSELLDVSLANLAGGQVLSYDSDAHVWKNRTLGAAAEYGVGQVESGNNGLVTGGSVFSYVTGVLSSVLKFQGTTTTAISDGSTTNPVVINGASYTAQKGDVVLYDGKEYLWQGSAWEQLGDESSWALKTTKIQAGTGLTGGGTLASNRTISLSSASIASLALADTAYQKPSAGIPKTDLASAVQTSLNNGDTAYGYFSNGVLPYNHGGTGFDSYTKGNIIYASATDTLAKLAPNSTSTKKYLTMTSSVPSWGSIAYGDLPAMYIGNAAVQNGPQTAQNVGGLGNLTLANARGIKFLNKPSEGSATEITALTLTTANALVLGGGTLANGYQTAIYGSPIRFYTDAAGGSGATRMRIDTDGTIVPYKDIVPYGNNVDLGSSSAFFAEAYAKKLYIAAGIYIEYDTTGNYVHINAPLVTDGDQIVTGGTPGGGSGGGKNYLHELLDVYGNPGDVKRGDGTTRQGGDLLGYNSALNLWVAVDKTTVGVTTAGTVNELNAANPLTALRVWSPSVLASWLAGKNFLTSAVTNVAVGTGDNSDNLAITKDGSTSYLTVPYATNVKRFKRYVGTAESGGYDLNTLLSGGGITSQYSASSYWGNRPDTMSFGGVLQINPQASNSLAMQLAWDVVHNATTQTYKTGKLWWRDATYHNSAAEWGEWHLIYDDTTLTKAVVAGLLDDGNGTYVKLNPGSAEQTISSNIGTFEKGVVNLWRKSGDHYTFLGFSNGTTETYLGGIGFKSQSDHNLYRKDVVNNSNVYYKIFDASNANLSTIDWTAKDLTAAGALSVTGAASVNKLTIASTAGEAHIAFSRGGYNYITTPASGMLNIITGGRSLSLANSTAVFTDTEVRPGANATYSLGTGTYCWEGIYGRYLELKKNGGASLVFRGTTTLNNQTHTILFKGGTDTDSNGFKIETVPATSYGRQGLGFYTSDVHSGSAPYTPDWKRSLYISHGGTVYVGATDHANQLVVYGTATIGTATAASGAALTVNGVIASSGDQVVTSDIRVKRNIKPIELTVEQIASCRAVTFDWASGGHSFGSIAQDWEPILPEAVKDGDVKALAYGQLGLVAAINIARHETEQDKEIRQLKERVKNLEDEVKRLTA